MVQSDSLVKSSRFSIGSVASTDPSVFSLTFDWSRKDPNVHVKEFIKTSYLTVVSYCIDQLKMMKHVFSSSVEEYEVYHLPYKTIDERFGIDDANLDEFKINSVYTEMHKLQKDVSVLIYLLQTLIIGARTHNTCDTVNNDIKNLDAMYDDEEKLIGELKEKRKLVTYLRLAQIKEREESFNLMTDLANAIKSATRCYHDQVAYTHEEVVFIKNWQRARHEQNTIKLKQKENMYIDTAEDMQNEIELENRCHNELETFIAESQTDYMNEIQYWMDQYETTMENKEQEIYSLRMDLEKLNDKAEALKLEYDERTQTMEDYLLYKRRKREEEEHLALEIWAARTIQAWWREVMIRKKLGPYRKHKGKKGKKNKKNKRK